MGKPREKNDGRGRLGGRKKGTPNKVSKEMKDLLAKFVDDRWDEFVAAYDMITEPEKKCQIMVSLIPYLAPRLASVEKKDISPGKSFEDELDEISGEKTRK
ncbi:MAG: hypothetical protein J6Y27_05220 [Bacteroidales bacterium]|nr:hypothetical protein [Bacteroidales bacterium]